MRFTSTKKRLSHLLLTFLCLLFFGADAKDLRSGTLGSSATDESEDERAVVNGYQGLIDKLNERGSVRVIVGLRDSANPRWKAKPEGKLTNPRAIEAQRKIIERLQSRLSDKLPIAMLAKVKRFKHIPYLALEVDTIALEQLARLPEVVTVAEDRLLSLELAASVPLVGAEAAFSYGYSGTGQTVAVLDTGVDSNHPFLSGKVVNEACFSTTRGFGNTSSLCPNGTDHQTGPGAGIHCTGLSGCGHGTHVAGIAVGRGSSFSGVAKDAKLIAIQVFSRVEDPNICGPSACLMAFTSDVIQALEHVYSLRNTHAIAAANLSIGGDAYTSTTACDADNTATKAAIDNLRSAGIGTVIAAGNGARTNAISAPACISSAVSVGATTKSDSVAGYANSASWLSLLAPGSSIRSAIPGGGFASISGTSMAAPHVSGAWAILKSKKPDATVDALIADLTNTGTPVTDGRNGLTKARIRIDSALGTTPLRISTADFPDGSVSAFYGVTLGAVGGTPPYSWSLTSGNLPDGLMLDDVNGIISGTPIVSGTFEFVLQVLDTDSAAYVARASITIHRHQLIIDNRDANTTNTGIWQLSGGLDPWADDSVYNNSGSTFRWLPNLPESGQYEVYAWWTYHNNRSVNVPYRIQHTDGVDTVLVNQRDAALGGQWYFLGNYTFSSGTGGYIEVSSENGQASADAVKLVNRTEPNIEDVALPQISPPGGVFSTPVSVSIETSTPGARIYYTLDDTEPTANSIEYVAPFTLSGSATIRAIGVLEDYNDSQVVSAEFSFDIQDVEVIVDNQDANTRRTGTWSISSGRDPWAGQSLYSNGGSSFRWLPELPVAEQYNVYVWWTYHANRSVEVPYRVGHANGIDTIIVNQHDVSLGGQWIFLGTYSFDSAGGYIEVSSENGQASADAVKFVK